MFGSPEEIKRKRFKWLPRDSVAEGGNIWSRNPSI